MNKIIIFSVIFCFFSCRLSNSIPDLNPELSNCFEKTDHFPLINNFIENFENGILNKIKAEGIVFENKEDRYLYFLSLFISSDNPIILFDRFKPDAVSLQDMEQKMKLLNWLEMFYRAEVLEDPFTNKKHDIVVINTEGAYFSCLCENIDRLKDYCSFLDADPSFPARSRHYHQLISDSGNENSKVLIFNLVAIDYLTTLGMRNK